LYGVEQTAPRPPRKVTMLQRTPGPMGRSLGKTTGWVHRMELKRAGVEQISGVAYERIDDAGLHIASTGRPAPSPPTPSFCAPARSSASSLPRR